MENQLDYFIAEIVDVPLGTEIIYYIEVLLAHGEKIVENNDGKYFRYKVGLLVEHLGNNKSQSTESIEKSKVEFEDELDKMSFNESFQFSDLHINNQSDVPPPQPKKYHVDDTKTIFGTLQTQIDPELKVCSFCNSKIKKMWSTCPICGKNL